MTATRITGGSGSTTGVPSGWFDVATYGAVGDDTADDTTAIQSAITAASAVGGVVYFTPGKTYKVSSTLTVAGVTPLSLMGGSGQGWSQANTGSPTIHWTGGAGSGACLQFNGGALSISLQGIRFMYSNAAYTGAGTNLVNFNTSGTDAQQCVVRNCAFNSNFAINPGNGARSLLRLNEWIIGEVSNCHFGGCQDAIMCGDTSFVVSAEIHNCTFNFAQSSFIRLGAGDIEALTIRNNTFEDCPANGAIYNDATGQTYSLRVVGNWFGDSSNTYTVAWLNGLSATSNNFTGIIEGNRMAANPWAMKLVGDWLVIGNTIETAGAYRTSTFTLTDISNFYNMAGSAVFEAGHPPNATGYKQIGSHAVSGAYSTGEAHLSGGLHVGGSGAASGVNATENVDSNAQLWLGVNGANGAGVIASANRGMVYTDFNTGYNGPGILRLQSPGIQTTNEVQLIAGTTAPAPLVRASEAKLAFYNVAPVAQASRAGQLTDNTAGTVTSTLAAGIADAVAKNAIASLAAKVNALETIIHNLGLSA